MRRDVHFSAKHIAPVAYGMFHLAYEHGPENCAQYTMSSSIPIDIDIIVPSDASHSKAGSQVHRSLQAMTTSAGSPGARSRHHRHAL